MTYEDVITILTNTAAINNFILIAFILIFAVIFMLDSRNPNSGLSWRDLLLDSKTNKLSVTKFGQFWGIAVSTWVVIFMAQSTAAYSIFPMVFPMYLAFIGGTWSYQTWLKSKQGSTNITTLPTPATPDTSDKTMPPASEDEGGK